MFSEFFEINHDFENINTFEREDDSRDIYSGKNNFTFYFGINKDIEDINGEEIQKIYFIEKDSKTPLKEKYNECFEKNDNTKENTKSKSSSKETPKIQEKIFDINKVNKKQGRLPKIQKESIKGKHNKFSEDNIIQKIKTNFQEKIFNYVNYEYEKFLLEGQNYNDQNKINTSKLIKRISPKEINKIKKEDNLNWFSLKLKVLLSSSISSKYNKFESDYNEKRIKNLYEKKRQ